MTESEDKKSHYGLKRLSVEQIKAIHDATAGELAKRAKASAKKKSPHEMDLAEFEDYKRRLFSKDTGDNDDE